MYAGTIFGLLFFIFSLISFAATDDFVFCKALVEDLRKPQNLEAFKDQIEKELDPRTGQNYTILDTSSWFLKDPFLRIEADYFDFVDKSSPLEQRSRQRDFLGFSRFSFKKNEAGEVEFFPTPAFEPIEEVPEEFRVLSELRYLWLKDLLELAQSEEAKNLDLEWAFIGVENQPQLRPKLARALSIFNLFKGKYHVDPSYYTIITATSAAGTWVRVNGKSIEVPLGHTIILSGVQRGYYFGEAPNLKQKLAVWHAVPDTDRKRIVYVTVISLKGGLVPEEDKSRIATITIKSIFKALFFRNKRPQATP